MEELSVLEQSILDAEKELVEQQGKVAAENEIDEIVEEVAQEEESESEAEEEAEEEIIAAGDEIEEITEPKGNSDWAKMRKRLKEEKERSAKEAQEKQELLNRLAYIEGKLSSAPQPQQPQPEQPKQYDPIYEFEDHTRQELQVTKSTAQQAANGVETLQQKLDREIMALRAERYESEASRENPSYTEAKKLIQERVYDGLYEKYRSDLIDMRPEQPIEAIDQYMKANEGYVRNAAKEYVDKLVRGTVRSGGSVADAIVGHAKKVYGYNPSPKKDVITKPAINNESVRKNMKKSASLINGGAGKGKASDRLTHNEIADAVLSDLMGLDDAEWRNVQ